MPDYPAASLSISEILQQKAALQPDRIVVTHLRTDDDREHLTFGDLDRRARGIARWLLGRPGNDGRALLVYPTGLDFVAAFFGCLYAGVQPVPLAHRLRPRNMQSLSAVAANSGASLALTDDQTLRQMARGDAMEIGLAWAASDAIPPADSRDLLPVPDLRSLAYLQYTSGSTTLPRGVRISHLNLIGQLQALVTSYRAGPDEVLVSWLPHFHDMGLVGKLLLSVFLGAHCVILSPLQFMQRPARWLQAISDFRGTISAAPNFGYELCLGKVTAAERRTIELSSWRLALNGAEPVRAGTHRRFQALFAENGLRLGALCPCYGLAEATLMVSSCRPWLPVKVVAFERPSLLANRPMPASGTEGVELVGCGPPAEGVKIAIVDPQGRQPVADSTIGEIWVKGDSVAQGYFNSPEATSESFGARLPDGDGPYLRTGDLGFYHEGELFIAGRLKDLIIIHGRNLHPQEVEQTAQADRPAVIAGRGAAFGVDIKDEERLVLIQELRSRTEVDCAVLIGQIRTAIARAFEVQPAAIFLVRPGTLPVTSSGKLARHRARDLLLQGDIAPVAMWHAADCPRFAVAASPVPS